MKDYKPNSDAFRNEHLEKKQSPVIKGSAKIRKKSELQKFADIFIAEDAHNVKSYLLDEVIVPALKDTISKIINNGVDMILYGEPRRNRNNAKGSRISYRNYYERERETEPIRRSNFDYDAVILETRADAEIVLDSMADIIDQYGMVSVSDMYDLAHVPNDNYTLNKYGWKNVAGAEIVKDRDGYILKLPRAIPLY